MTVFIPAFIHSLKPFLLPFFFQVPLYLPNVIAKSLCAFRKLRKRPYII